MEEFENFLCPAFVSKVRDIWDVCGTSILSSSPDTGNAVSLK